MAFAECHSPRATGGEKEGGGKKGKTLPRGNCFTSTASLREPASRKKAAECRNRCFPSSEKAFFSAAFLHRSSLKLFLKKSVILAFF